MNRTSPRQRLLAAADELFCAEGIQTVGVDRIVKHAGVAKSSLYRLFGSKENLWLAWTIRTRQFRSARVTR
jgi:AcrR family transcriptional regulator